MTMNRKNQEGELESSTTREAVCKICCYKSVVSINIPFYDVHSRTLLYKNAKLKHRITLDTNCIYCIYWYFISFIMQ